MIDRVKKMNKFRLEKKTSCRRLRKIFGENL